MRIVVLTGGIGGARFLVGVRAHARADRRRGHGGGQRRRRRTPARPADLPRPGQRHVHAGRRRRPRARLGPGRRDLGGQGGAGRVRRRADLVRPGRQGHRHPPGPHPDARRRLSAVRGHRGAVRALAARRHACCPATDDRLETHVVVDVDGRAKAIHFQEWWVRHRGDVPTHRFVFVGAETAKPARRRARGDRGAPTWCWSRRATRWSASRRSWPCPRCARRSSAGPAPVVGVSPDHRRRAGAGHGRPVPGRASASRCTRGRRRRALRRALATAACSTAGWSTPVDADAAVPGRDDVRAVPAVDDRRGTATAAMVAATPLDRRDAR